MAYAKATLIREIRTILNDNPFVTACTEAMDATETDLDVALREKFDQGDILEFQDDGERVLVTATGTGAGALTVIRNFDGSSGAAVGTGTTHSSGVLVAKNPVFTYLSVVDAIADSIYGLWPYVYKLVSDDITPVAGTKWYEVDEVTADNATEMIELSSVVQVIDSKPFIYGSRRTSYPVRLHFGVPTSIAGSGVAVEIPYLRSTAADITVRGIGKVTPAISGGNYADFSAGVEATTIKYYAIAAMIERTGISRVTQEDISMSDESVRPGARESVAQYYERKALMERRKWEMHLKQTLPRKFKKAGDYS